MVKGKRGLGKRLVKWGKGKKRESKREFVKGSAKMNGEGCDNGDKEKQGEWKRVMGKGKVKS
jgi:hypothetical protein